jgi:nickel-dependent lactate racemase
LISPLDKNLYQAQKALENCQDAVADGGSAVVFSACEEGVGSRYFFEQASGWDRERNESVDGVERFGSHKLSRVNAMTRRIDVRLHSELDDETVRRVFYEPLADVSEYIGRRAEGNTNYRLAVVHDAGHTVLRRQTT